MTAEHDDPDAYLPGYSGAIAMSAGEIANTRWQSFREQPGVQVRELWRSADGVAGLLRLEPGAQEPENVAAARLRGTAHVRSPGTGSPSGTNAAVDFSSVVISGMSR